MTKNPTPTPIKVKVGTANSKLVGSYIPGTKLLKYVGATTYSEVGGTCPTSCWYHPVSDRRAEWPVGFKSCYAGHGKTAFSTSAKAFEGASFDDFGLLQVSSQLENMLSSHVAEDLIVDLFRWHTGGDVLYPNTGEVWPQHIDLITDIAVKMTGVGIPLIGYTAAWRLDGVQPLKHLFLASVQSREEAELAVSMGWQIAMSVVIGIKEKRLKQIIAGALPTDDEVAELAKFDETLEFMRSLGLTVIKCPEQWAKADSCAECGWCATLDPQRLRKHTRSKYMLYRKRGKSGLAGSVLFFVHS